MCSTASCQPVDLVLDDGISWIAELPHRGLVQGNISFVIRYGLWDGQGRQFTHIRKVFSACLNCQGLLSILSPVSIRDLGVNTGKLIKINIQERLRIQNKYWIVIEIHAAPKTVKLWCIQGYNLPNSLKLLEYCDYIMHQITRAFNIVCIICVLCSFVTTQSGLLLSLTCTFGSGN